MKITYVRWCMTVIEMNDLTIVTDPAFRMLGFPLRPLQYSIEDLKEAEPDVILISHGHWDHWDTGSMRQLEKDIHLIVPPRSIAPGFTRGIAGGIAGRARRLGYTSVEELRPWEQTDVGGVVVTAVPGVHWGGEVGFVLQGEKTVYFAGDTAFDRQNLAEIGQRFDTDVVLLPIGGLRFLGGRGQMGPKEAVTALDLVRPRVVIGTHWGGLPNLPPLVEMRGTPQQLADLVAETGMNVHVVVPGTSPVVEWTCNAGCSTS
jgi:L-ascorbate metabolism protein UlaG (beta-lactamase superfamily)